MEENILIFTTEDHVISVKTEGNKSLESVRGGKKVENYISKRDLAKEIASFSEVIQSAMNTIDDANSIFQLNEIIVNAEISGGGKIGFLGFGASAGMKSGLSFKFTRRPDK